MTTHDAIVIGSGATGGWAAKQLTQRGLRVLVLEAGPALDDAPRAHAPRAWSPAAHARFARQPIQGWASAASHPELFVDDLEHPYTTPPGQPYRWLRSRVLGGRTLSWNGITQRFSDLDFAARDHDGTGDNWPIRYAELAPHYATAERWLGVAGSRAHLPQLPDGAFLPARQLTAAERTIRDRSAHLVIPQRGIVRPAMMASVTSTLAAARRTGRLTVRTDAIVSHLVRDRRSGRARRVACIDRVTGRAFEVAGTVVLLCASAIESTRILLHSELPSPALGRYLMDHVAVGVSGTMRARRGTRTTALVGGPYGACIPRFVNLGQAREPGYVRGFGIQVLAQRGVPAPELGRVPVHMMSFGEVLARADNQLSLDRTRTDAWGLPVPRIACTYGDNELAIADAQLAALGELIAACGIELASTEISIEPPGTSIHECGGARMGDDPERSVVDRDNRCWTARNVFVTDGACFVSSPCQNPTLTMMALTIRACARILELGRRNEL